MLTSDPYSPGNKICQQIQQAWKLQFTSTHSTFLEHTGHILNRLLAERKVPAMIVRWHSFQVNPMLWCFYRGLKMADIDWQKLTCDLTLVFFPLLFFVTRLRLFNPELFFPAADFV